MKTRTTNFMATISTLLLIALGLVIFPTTAEAKVAITTGTNGDVTVEFIEDGTNSVYVDGTVLESGKTRNCTTASGNKIEIVNEVKNSGGTIVAYDGQKKATTLQGGELAFYTGGDSKIIIKEIASKEVKCNGNIIDFGKEQSYTDKDHSNVRFFVKNHMTKVTGTISEDSDNGSGSGDNGGNGGGSSDNGGGSTTTDKNKVTVPVTCNPANKIAKFTDVNSSDKYWSYVEEINNRGGLKGMTVKRGYTWDKKKGKYVQVSKKKSGTYLDMYSLAGIHKNAKQPSGYISKKDCIKMLRNLYGKKYVPASDADLKNTAATQQWLTKKLTTIAKKRGVNITWNVSSNNKLMKLEAMMTIVHTFKINGMDPSKPYTYVKK